MIGKRSGRVDLSRIPWLSSLLRNPWPLFLGRAVMLAGFVFTVLVGLLGTPVGGRNFAIIFVWIAWWTVLKLILIPLGGRSWCSVCPIPVAGEWAQRGGILRQGKGVGLQLRWPRKLRGSWLQLAGFAFMGLFSAVLLTVPSATGWILLILIVVAVALGLVFERRVFCRYLCPIGGFIGWYAQLAPLEVRVRDRTVCRTCSDKPCYEGCTWGLFPSALTQNLDCGLCMACLRICPYDNMALQARPFGADLAVQAAPRQLDRAWFGLFLLACAPIYGAVMLGPWGWLTEAAYAVGSPAWLRYAAVFLGTSLGIVPGLFWLAVWAGWRLDGRSGILKRRFTRLSYALSPLGLTAWIAFTLTFAFSKLAHVWPVLSDPLGVGWNLLGTADWAWQPYLVDATPVLQVLALLGGLLWTVIEIRRVTSLRASLPAIAYGSAFTALMLWLLL